MGKVFQFPETQRLDEDGYPPLLGIPAPEVMDRVFEANLRLLGVMGSRNLVECLEFYTDKEFPNKILVDIGDVDVRPGIRGLYEVDLETYKLNRLAPEPLRHFT